MKKTFFKGIGFGALTAMLLMFSLLLFSCEKEPVEIPIENLELGDTYEGGIVYDVNYDAAGNYIYLMEPGDVGTFPSSGIEAQAHGEWHVPNNNEIGQLKTYYTFNNVEGEVHGLQKDGWYWYYLQNTPRLRQIKTETVHRDKPDDGETNLLRLVRKIYF